MGKLNIDLLGTSFSVQAGEDDQYLAKLLAYYTDIITTIQRSGSLKDPLKTSILAGIALVDELYKAKKQTASHDMDQQYSDSEAERLTMDMIEKIDEVL